MIFPFLWKGKMDSLSDDNSEKMLTDFWESCSYNHNFTFDHVEENSRFLFSPSCLVFSLIFMFVYIAFFLMIILLGTPSDLNGGLVW